jgi:hypothetical protein
MLAHYVESEERRHVRVESGGVSPLCQNVSILSGGEENGIETYASKISACCSERSRPCMVRLAVESRAGAEHA